PVWKHVWHRLGRRRVNVQLHLGRIGRRYLHRQCHARLELGNINHRHDDIHLGHVRRAARRLHFELQTHLWVHIDVGAGLPDLPDDRPGRDAVLENIAIGPHTLHHAPDDEADHAEDNYREQARADDGDEGDQQGAAY